MKGTIFDIQGFSVFDGPGARTVVFFKGCNLRCKWCHNPESIEAKPQIQLKTEQCIGCKKCSDQCVNNIHFDLTRCTNCLKCVDGCFAGARTAVGTEISSVKLMEEIREDVAYYKTTGGGVTFSGGECMLQIDFLETMLKSCKTENIHTAVDTAGHVPWQYFQRVNPYVDLYLYDIKALGGPEHKKLTGVANQRIIGNYKKLIESGKKVIVRVPYIVGANEDQMDGIVDLLKDHRPTLVEVLPYHSLGMGKQSYLREGHDREVFSEPTKEQMVSIKKKMKEKGLKVT